MGRAARALGMGEAMPGLDACGAAPQRVRLGNLLRKVVGEIENPRTRRVSSWSARRGCRPNYFCVGLLGRLLPRCCWTALGRFERLAAPAKKILFLRALPSRSALPLAQNAFSRFILGVWAADH